MEIGKEKDYKMFEEFKSLPTSNSMKNLGVRNLREKSNEDGIFEEFKSLPSPSTLKRFAVSAIGAIPRQIAKLKAVPHEFGEMISNLSAMSPLYKLDQRPKTTEYDQRMREKYGPSYDQPNPYLAPFPNLFESQPTYEQSLEKMRQGTLGKILPEGSLTGTGPVEKYVDAAVSGAINLGLMGGAGAVKSAQSLMPALKSIPRMATKALPITTAGVLGKDIGKQLGFGPTGQTVTELGSMAAVGSIPGVLNYAKSKIPGSTSDWGRKTIERTAPITRDIFQTIDTMERQKLITAKTAMREKKAAEKITQKSDLFRFREELENKKNLEAYRKENLAARQEELETLKTQKVEHQTKIKQLNEQKKLLDKQEAETIAQQSKLDAMKLREKSLTGQALEKQKAATIAQQSKLDAIRTKKKGIEAEIQGVEKEHVKVNQGIEDIKLLEDVAVEHFGATPEVLKKRAKRLYTEYDESIPKDAYDSGSKLQSVIDQGRKEMQHGIEGKSFEESSKRVMEGLFKEIEGKIHDGKIDLRDLSAIRQDISEQIARLQAKHGSLYRFEKNMFKFPKAIDQMLDTAVKKYPSMKPELFHEANRLTRNSHLSGEYINWSEKWFPGSRKKMSEFLQNPEYRKKIGASFEAYTKGEFVKAAKNLIAMKGL